MILAGDIGGTKTVLAALKAERFAPATVDGIPVRSLVVQPVRLQVE